MSFQVKNNISSDFANNYDIKTTRLNRKKLKRKQRRKFGFTVVIFILLTFFLPQLCWNTYDFLFFKRIRNAAIQIPTDLTFLRSAEKYFANEYFLNTEFLADINTQKPIMKKIVLTTEMKRLSNELKYLAKVNPSILPGIFIWDFQTGKYVSINAENEFSTASMIKIPVLFQLFRRAELGLVNLNDSMILEPYYITGGSGYLQYKPPGMAFSVFNLAQLMIQESDNTATNMLLSAIGGTNDLNRVIRSWGFSKTHLSDLLPDLAGTNVATPKDFGTMLYNIDNSEFLSLGSRAQIVEIMSHVRNRFLIKAGLPDNVQFIHKSGNIGTMLGDAGIVMLPDGRKYIIVIMVKRPFNSYTAKEFIIQASKITYDSIASRNY